MRSLIAMMLGLGLAANAQAAGFRIEVAGGQDVRLAIDTPAGADGKGFEETLRADLFASGYFTLIDESGHLDKSGQVTPGSFDFDDWTLLKTDVLVKTQVREGTDPACGGTTEDMCVDAYVYYVVAGETLVKKRLKTRANSVRYLGHEVANLVVESVTGQPGEFGNRIAAVGNQSGNKEVYVLDSDGKGVAPVTRNGSINLSPAWSSDGRKMAWTSYKKGNPDLYLKDLGTGRTRVISNRYGINTSPAFSPDGKTLAVVRSTDADSDIWLIDANTGADIKRLTTGGGIDVSPSFTPDGSAIVFASERSGGSQVYKMDLATGKVDRITFQGGFNGDPVVHPDGDKIAFVGRVSGGFDVYVVGMDGKGMYRITQDMGDNEDPSWSPDGRYLIFSSTRKGPQQIWMSTTDGRHQVPVTKSGGWSQPTFAP